MEQTHDTSNRITLIRTKDYEVDLEYNEKFFILHLPYVEKFTKTVYLDMLETLDDIHQFARTLGYPVVFAAVSSQDEKMKKFLAKLNFKHQGLAEGYDVFCLEEES